MPSSILVGQTIGSYRIVRPLGEGGMGAVYEAVHKTLNRRCAIKVLQSQYANDPVIAARFLQEAKAANLVQHPGIVQIFEFGQLADQTPYFVMEFLDGDTLSTRIRRAAQRSGGGGLGRSGLVTCWAIAKVCSVVHQQGLVHRDLKPANIMIVPDADIPGGERIKLLDFGIVKASQAGDEAQGSFDVKTRTGSVMGTPQYMAPEQWRGQKNIDGRTDVYALGVILYLTLTGRLPFDHDDLPVLGMMHCFNEPPLLTDLDPSLPLEVATLGIKMLQKDPGKRPAMSEVAGTLKNILGMMSETEQRPTEPGASRARSEARAEPQTLDPALLKSSVSLSPKLSIPHSPNTPPTADEGEPHDTNPDSAPQSAKKMAGLERSNAKPQRKSDEANIPLAPKQAGTAPLPAPPPVEIKKRSSPTAPTLRSAKRRSWQTLLLVALGLTSAVGVGIVIHNTRTPEPLASADLGGAPDLMTTSPPSNSVPAVLPDLVTSPVPPDLAVPPDISEPEPPDLQPAEPQHDMAKNNKPFKPSSKPACVPILPTEACITSSKLSISQRELIIKAFKRSGAKMCVGERLVLSGLPALPRVSVVPPSMDRAGVATRTLTLTLRGLLSGDEFPSQVELQCSAP